MNKLSPIGEKVLLSDLSLIDFISLLWAGKNTLILSLLIGSIIGVSYSLSLNNIYRSEALLAPTHDGGELGGFQQFSGLANIAGISMPSTDNSLTKEAMATITSFKFFNERILPNIFLPDLLAYDSWNANSNENSYDSNLFDISTGKWLGNSPKGSSPSAQTAFKAFRDSIIISKDNETSFIKIAITHQSPYIAKSWADTVIYEINEALREEQKQESTISKKFLEDQLMATSYSDIRMGLSQLIKNETEKLMLIEASEDYIFKSIDPPIVPELKSFPKRSQISLLGAIFGLAIGLIVLLVSKFGLSRNNVK